MAILNRVRVSLLGFAGAPGVGTFICQDPTSFRGPLNTLLADMAQFMPPVVSLAIEDSGDVFDSVTGVISGTWSAAHLAAHPGTGPAGYAGPTGFMTEWLTDVHLSGRRLRGRTFWVPSSSSIFDTDGTLTPGVVATITTTASAFLAGTLGNFTIWQRPRLAKPADGTRKAVTARSGGFGSPTSIRIPDKAVVLRSRRD